MAIAELVGFLSGFKGRLLLFAGLALLAGSLWSNGLRISPSGEVFDSTVSLMESTLKRAGESEALDFYPRKVDAWGASVVPLGLSFLAAMIAGSILRSTIKVGVTLLLLCGVAVALLESQGYGSFWDEYFQSVEQGGGWLVSRAEVLGKVLQDHLPSLGAALIGFGFGLRR
ncbi:MAG: hypothetical protein B9S36_02275 [Verrucomicrobiia bacterium Tous-C2TDCM]|nr:MAG: hypothetical protein B9S36_02275 [Verrucomicrobiae bacterium Tous-C2TDCM]